MKRPVLRLRGFRGGGRKLGLKRSDADPFRALVEQIPGVVYRCSQEAPWRVFYVSGGIYELTGFRPDAFRGMEGRTLESLIHLPDRERVAREVSRALAVGEGYDLEYRMVHRNGRLLWVHERGGRIRDEAGRSCLQGVFLDVTATREVERTLEDLRERLEVAASAAGLGIWERDLATGHLAWDDRMREIYGWSEAEGIPDVSCWLSMVHPEDRGRIQARIREAIASGGSCQEEIRVLRRDGVERYVRVIARAISKEPGVPLRLVGINEDITASWEARQALADREERLRLALLASSDGLWDWNLATGRVHFSPRFWSMLGYEADAFPPDPLVWKNLVHPEDLAGIESRLDAHLKGLSPGYEATFRMRACDQTWVWILGRGQVVARTGAGTPERLVGTHTDISRLKTVELALRDSLSELRDLMKIIPAGIIILGHREPDRFFLLHGNEEAERLTGLRMEACLGREVEAVWPSFRDSGLREPLLETLRGGEIFSEEQRVLGEGLGRRVFRIRAHALPGDRLVVAFEDVTSRVQAEQRIRASEERFRNLLEHLEIIPVQGYDQERRVIYWNAASERVYGYRREEALGRVLEELIIPGEMREQVRSDVTSWVRGGPAIPSGEVVLRDRNHQPVPVYSTHIMYTSGDGTREMYCVDVDLRALHHARREMSRLEAAVEQAGEIIVITEPDGSIVYVNPAFEAITGYRREEVLGQNPRLLKSGVHDQAFYEQLWGTLLEGGTWKGRLVNRRKDGRLYTEEATLSPVRNAAGETVHFVGVKTDITAQLALEEQFHQAQKMESVGRLAGGVAHDYNNMLGVILGYLELGMDKLPPQHPLMADLEQIRLAARRSVDLTRQLLAFARKQAVVPRRLQLNRVVSEMLSMLRPLLGEEVDLRWAPEERLERVLLDPTQVEQILTNLCINARDAMSGRGRLEIRTANRFIPEPWPDRFGDLEPGAYVLLEVVDQGTGMDATVLEHLFEPFFTTKPVGRGTGLGLAMVYGMVRQNRGGIRVETGVGRGTTFRLFFPALGSGGGEEADGNALPAGSSRRDGGARVVLLVEDEEALLTMIGRMLEAEGYRVLSARSGGEALRISEEIPALDLLLSDVVMPRMNGRDLGNAIRERFPQLPILFMSGYPSEMMDRGGVLEEGVAMVQKPFSREVLLGAMRRLLRVPLGRD